MRRASYSKYPTKRGQEKENKGDLQDPLESFGVLRPEGGRGIERERFQEGNLSGMSEGVFWGVFWWRDQIPISQH